MIHCVVSCHVMQAMSCDVRSRDELSPVVPCVGCEVLLCGSKWFCDDVVFQSITLYYKVLLQY